MEEGEAGKERCTEERERWKAIDKCVGAEHNTPSISSLLLQCLHPRSKTAGLSFIPGTDFSVASALGIYEWGLSLFHASAFLRVSHWPRRKHVVGC